MSAYVELDHAASIDSRRLVPGGGSSYVGQCSDQHFFVHTRGDGFGDVRVRVRYFGGDSEIIAVLALGEAFCDVGDGGVFGAGDGR